MKKGNVLLTLVLIGALMFGFSACETSDNVEEMNLDGIEMSTDDDNDEAPGESPGNA